VLQTTQQPIHEFITREQLAKRWVCSLSTVKRIEAGGDIAAVKIGKVVRYRMSDVLAYENRGQGTTPSTK
jgi:hypothetical protein